MVNSESEALEEIRKTLTAVQAFASLDVTWIVGSMIYKACELRTGRESPYVSEEESEAIRQFVEDAHRKANFIGLAIAGLIEPHINDGELAFKIPVTPPAAEP